MPLTMVLAFRARIDDHAAPVVVGQQETRVRLLVVLHAKFDEQLGRDVDRLQQVLDDSIVTELRIDLEFGVVVLQMHELVSDDGLGDLEREQLWLEVGVLEGQADRRDETRVLQLDTGDVHVDADRWLAGASELPRPRLTAGLAEDELADWDHQPGPFGDRDELSRRDDSALRMNPADQSLHRDEGPVRQGHDRLVFEDELATFDRAAQVDAQRQALARRILHRPFESRDLVLAGFLRVIHRDVGRAQEVRRTGQPRGGVGDTDAAADPDRALG